MTACANVGAEIVEITSEAENNFVNSISNGWYLWLNCRDHLVEGQAVCGDDNHPMTYRAFGAANPNTGAADCVYSLASYWGWLACTTPISVMCEIDGSNHQRTTTSQATTRKPDPTTQETTTPRPQTPEPGKDLFFPHGLSEGDDFLPANDDNSSPRQQISIVFPFFDYDHISLFVNNNGGISFLDRISQYTPDPFPLANDQRLIAPFWADVDTTNGGTLSYREVLRFDEHDELFLEADAIIRTSFIEMRNFVSSWMYIATWNEVAFYGSRDTSIRNSFQAVMVTDGRYSFAIFNYGDINWTTGTASGGNPRTGLGGIPAQVGFNAGDGVTFYNVPGSRTAAVVDIETTSNIGVPGRWVFRTDNSNIEGLECTSQGELSLFPLVGSMLGGTQVFISGPCFNSTSQVVCEFDSLETSGRLLSNKTALCVLPTFYKVGRIPLRVSLDGGVTFLFKGTFTIASPEEVPDKVFSSVTESNQTESEFNVRWDTDALESVDRVDIVVCGYQEEGNVTDFSGPVVVLIRGIDYQLGSYNVSDIPGVAIDYDIGVIGVMESKDSPGSPTRAALWSKVHVLQWYNDNDIGDWCNTWLFKEARSDKSFFKDTPPCPCTFDQAQLDIGRFSPHPECDIDSLSPSNCIHKPGAMHCVRANIPSKKGGGQACCYDFEGAIINAYDSPGGGYIHRHHHGGVPPYEEPKKVPYLSHFLVDILPWTYCCRFGGARDGSCQSFARHRPSQLCDNYVPPPPGLGNGDPHIATLDSTLYTFNGYGEFTMMDALNGTFVLQARTAPLSGVLPATIFVAVATRYGDSDIIHVQTNGRRILDAYVKLAGDGQNFTRIDFDQAPRWTFTGVAVTGRNISADGILVAFDGGVGLTLKASEGAMNILLVAPDSFRGHTQGLMGTWNGNASDDFLTPQGSFLSPNLTTEELHYQFGLQWEIDPAESLFFYEADSDHESLTDRDYRPVFEPIPNPTVNQTAVEEVCGTNQFCVFDYQTTGSQSFAENSVQEFEQYEQAADNRASFVSCPSLPAPTNGSAIVSTYMAGGVARFVCDDGFEISHLVNLTCLPNGTWTDGDIPTCNAVYVPTEEAKSTTLPPTAQSTRSSASEATSPSAEETTGTTHQKHPSTTPRTFTSAAPAPASSKGLPGWSIALISIGSVFLTAMIGVTVVTVWCLYSPRRKTWTNPSSVHGGAKGSKMEPMDYYNPAFVRVEESLI